MGKKKAKQKASKKAAVKLPEEIPAVTRTELDDALKRGADIPQDGPEMPPLPKPLEPHEAGWVEDELPAVDPVIPDGANWTFGEIPPANLTHEYRHPACGGVAFYLTRWPAPMEKIGLSGFYMSPSVQYVGNDAVPCNHCGVRLKQLHHRHVHPVLARSE